MTCVSAPAPPSYVMLKQYDNPNCNGTAKYTIAYVQDVCIDTSYNNKNSSIYTCVDEIPYNYNYDGSATCTDTGTKQGSPLPTTCVR